MHNTAALLIPSLLAAALLVAGAHAEDTVVILAGKNGELRAQKRGKIIDYTGTQLRLQNMLGREEQIPADKIVEIRTEWTPSHQSGDALREQGKLTEAIAAYRQAKRDETRPWGVRQIMASLTDVYLESGQIASAGDEFLGIVASDPTTHFYRAIPLAWRTWSLDPSSEARAVTWLKATNFPAAVLLGASWLEAGAHRGEALAALQTLTNNPDARIAALAEMQLWRTRIVTVQPNEIQRWQTLVEKMPPEIRAGGYYILGDALARQKDVEAAALAYLRVPLVYSASRVLSSDALLAAAKQLEALMRPVQAAGLYREILADYAACPAAEEARARLDRLAAGSSEK
jgi:predicted negative regulator of RcsB-dependent stress response